MDCYHHEGIRATHACISCGSPLCLECRTYYGDSYCNACAIQRYRKLVFVFGKRSKFMAISFIIALIVYSMLAAFCIRYHIIHVQGGITQHIDLMIALALIPAIVGIGTGGVLFSIIYTSSELQRNKFINYFVWAILLGLIYAPGQIYLHFKNAYKIHTLRKLVARHPSLCCEERKLSHL